MLFERPTGLSEAVKLLLAKGLMPTALDTEGLRSLDVSLREQSFYSAETTSEYLLQKYRDRIGSILQPDLEVPGGNRPAYNPTYARAEIKNFLQEIGYAPTPGTEGTIKDLSSDPRINLVIETNRDMSLGQGGWIESQDPALLDEWPAQELFRAEARAVPRDWQQRWNLAGGETGKAVGDGWTITPQGKLIALKNHPIWDLVGSSKLFQDGLDQPWPPFAFNSGMWVRDVDRATAEDIGLIEPGQIVEPRTLAMLRAKQ